jgi:uncharacterized protein YjdB
MSSALITLTSDITETEIISSVKASNLNYCIMSPTKIDVYSSDTNKVIAWSEQYKDRTNIQISEIKLTPRLKYPTNITTKSTNSAFTVADLATIYKIPNPNTSTSVCIGVVSFGGGLYGTLQNGVLINGDIQSYWTSIGIPTNIQPRVIIRTISGAINNPNINDSGATIENTIDIQTLGGLCPNPNLTIILYIAPGNSLSQFTTVLNYIYNTTITVNSINYKPNIVSISWGAPEVYFDSTLLTNINSILATMANANINICTATGDNGSNDGVGGLLNYADFPSSSPHVTAVGGTSLICPNKEYDNSTIETAWSSGGGGVSAVFTKPYYQQSIPGNYRSIPDVASNADPDTGVSYIVNNENHIYGGTSIAAPTIAGFLATINNNILLNSRLYTASSICYNDISSGSNGGYNATIGYDNCTGNGTIVGNNLSSYLNSIASILISSLIVNLTTLNLVAGQTNQLNTIILPNNATNKVLSWISSNPNVASVSNGFVRSLSAGTTIITASTTDGSNLSTNTNVTVTLPIVKVTRVSLNPTSSILNTSDTLQLSAIITPANATNQNVIWSSSNFRLATVNQSGLVTAIKNGRVNIIVKTVDGNKLATCSLNIIIGVSSISILPSSINLNVKQNKKLIATILPTNSSNKKVTWTSSNNSIATVRTDGTVTCISVGIVTITATTVNNGLTDTSTIIVNPIIRNIELPSKIKSIRLSNSTLSLSKKQIATLNAEILPIDASNKLINWSSSNPKIAIVNPKGIIRALNSGTTTITVKTRDGELIETCIVTVN